jgi:hypothetical protein
LLSGAARERGVSRSEFIRQHLTLVLEPPTVGQLSRAMEGDRCFEDLALGLVDGSIVGSQSLSASAVWLRATCVTLPPFDSAMPLVRVGGSSNGS